MKLRSKLGAGIAGSLLLVGGIASYAVATEQQDDGGGDILTTTRYSEGVSVPDNSSGYGIDVHCPSGTRVTGGGFSGNYPSINLTVSGSMPGVTGGGDAEGWRAYVDNTSGSSQTVYVYAICVG